MFLHEVEIKNYRSLEHIRLDGLQQFNVLIGRNNAGKSSVFLALYDLYKILTGTGYSPDILTDRDARRTLEISLIFKPSQQERESFVDLLLSLGLDTQRRTAVLNSPLLRKIWFFFKSISLNPY